MKCRHEKGQTDKQGLYQRKRGDRVCTAYTRYVLGWAASEEFWGGVKHDLVYELCFQFQCWSVLRCPFLVFSRKIIEPFLFLRLSPPGGRWCDVLGFLHAGSVSSSSTLLSSETDWFRPFVMITFPDSFSARPVIFLDPGCQWEELKMDVEQLHRPVWVSYSTFYFL